MDAFQCHSPSGESGRKASQIANHGPTPQNSGWFWMEVNDNCILPFCKARPAHTPASIRRAAPLRPRTTTTTMPDQRGRRCRHHGIFIPVLRPRCSLVWSGCRVRDSPSTKMTHPRMRKILKSARACLSFCPHACMHACNGPSLPDQKKIRWSVTGLWRLIYTMVKYEKVARTGQHSSTGSFA